MNFLETVLRQQGVVYHDGKNDRLTSVFRENITAETFHSAHGAAFQFYSFCQAPVVLGHDALHGPGAARRRQSVREIVEFRTLGHGLKERADK